jgi:hypothetical protein
MTFIEFLHFVTGKIEEPHDEQYWQNQYNNLTDTSIENVQHEMPYLAVHAYAEYLTQQDFNQNG